MTDQQRETFVEYSLSLEQAAEMLSEVPFTETEDGSWAWDRPRDHGNYVALAEGDWVEIYLTERGGDLVLANPGDATGKASFEGDDARTLKTEVLRRMRSEAEARHAEGRMAYDLDAVRRVVEEETEAYAGEIEYACGWKEGSGKPDEITVTEDCVTVSYGGALPPVLAGPLKESIVHALSGMGFDYRFFGRVRIEPVEGVDV